jgi:hypothetical protein
VKATPAAEPYPWRVALGFVAVITVVAGLMAMSMELLPLPWVPPAAELAYQVPVQRAVVVMTAPSGVPDAALVSEITDAFQNYSAVRAEAEWSLDGSRLAEIMPDPELSGSLRYLDELRATGRAVRTNVEHNMRITRATADEAEIVDEVSDWSVYVDLVTRQPLQPDPAGRQLTEIYFLRKIDGVWKVVGEG